MFRISLSLLISLFVSCRPSTTLIPGLSSDQQAQQKQSESIPLGDSRCTYGGVLFTSWVDQKKIDGIYTEGVDTDFSQAVSCFTVPQGNTTIVTKPGDFKVIATDVAVGDTDCPQGGKKYESFIDVDGNSTYNSTVDTNYNAKKICNGLNGTASLSGANGVIITRLSIILCKFKNHA